MTLNDQPRITGGEPSRKLGVKYLDTEQMGNTFPDYQALLDRIEEHRQIADYAARLPGREHTAKRQPQMYDNVYAVLGGRGTGKSSVILTLCEWLKQDRNHQDLVFPIITPEIISEDNCSILGWIMSMTEQIVTQIEERVKQMRGRYDPRSYPTFERIGQVDFFKDCLFNSHNQLREHYQALMRDSIQDDIPPTAFPFDEAVGLRVHLSHKQYQLIQRLNQFWDELSETWRELNQLDHDLHSGISHGQSETRVPQPLIILFFDDIDLVPERSMELLNSTFQYFTHSSIVLIITAAEKVLKEVIQLRMLERTVGSTYNSLLLDAHPVKRKVHSDSMWKSIQNMAKEYYNKVLPPANRYRLRRFESISERRRYHYANSQQSFEMPQGVHSFPLNEFLKDQVDKLIQSFELEQRGQRKNFLLSESGSFRESYFIIFGDKNRNIANSCLEILNCTSQLGAIVHTQGPNGYSARDYEGMLHILRHMVRALMLSISDLADLSEQVDRFLYRHGPDNLPYVDYTAALDCYLDERRKVGFASQKRADSGDESPSREGLEGQETRADVSRLHQRTAIHMMILYFAENLLYLMVPDKIVRGGYPELSYLLNSDSFSPETAHSFSGSGFKLFPSRMEMDQFLDRSPLVLEHMDRYVRFDPYDQTCIQDYLLDTFYSLLKSQKDGASLLRGYQITDREWVRSVLSMLFLRYSGVTQVDRGFLEFAVKERNQLECVNFGGPLNAAIVRELESFLRSSSLEETAAARLKELENILKNPQQEWDIPLDEQFLRGSNLSVQEKNLQFEQLKKEQATRFIQGYFLRSWAAEHGRDGGDGQDKELSFRLIAFVEAIIRRAAKAILSCTRLQLRKDTLEKLQTLMSHNYSVSLDLLQQRNLLCAEVDRGMRWFEAHPNEAATQYAFPSEPMLNYVFTLYDALFDTASVPDETLEYFRAELMDQYFKLLELLRLYDRYESRPVSPFLPLDLEDMAEQTSFLPEQQESSEEFHLAFSSWIILDLKTAEFLIPYYFAARMKVALSTPTPKAGPRHSRIVQYPDRDAVDQELKKLYKSLTTSRGSSKLRAIMNEVRTDLAQQYIKRLENAL